MLRTKESVLFSTWIISLIATLGSLFISEVMRYEPCELCWYQRILMYPLFIFTTICLIKKEYSSRLYTIVMCVAGIVLSGYHYLIQKVPFLHEKNSFCGRIPCNGEYINFFGFITIPFLALLSFVLILILNTVIFNKVRVK
ncbi:disulfide oxidoreductase [Priestia megaterium]|uniref:disulfide oxidoreductase n=1 Tax=Priestia megaterium TaxID=1404 RepID=UPI00279602F0|nr:disulfide oxidoreductase [Priestia megaterium]